MSTIPAISFSERNGLVVAGVPCVAQATALQDDDSRFYGEALSSCGASPSSNEVTQLLYKQND